MIRAFARTRAASTTCRQTAGCGVFNRWLVFGAMGVIDVRRFDVATYFGDGGDLEVADISLADEDAWDIDLAEVVKVNALAVPADRELTYRVMQHELRLLLSFLVERPETRSPCGTPTSGRVRGTSSGSFPSRSVWGCSPRPLSATTAGS